MFHKTSVQFSSVTQSCLTLCDPMNRSTPFLSPTPRVHPNPRPSSRWCHPAISSSVVPFSCSQSLPASEFFPMSQLFAWGGQRIGVSALASVLPKNTQHWSPLEWTGWISLQSKGLSRVFSNTTVQKHQFFGTQLLTTILVFWMLSFKPTSSLFSFTFLNIGLAKKFVWTFLFIQPNRKKEILPYDQPR